MAGTFMTVQEVLENYKSAVYEKDVERFISSYSPDIHVYDCWGNWESVGIRKWTEMATGWFTELAEEDVILNVEFNDVVINEGTSLAFVHCAVTFAAHSKETGKKLRQITNRFTFGLIKQRDSWVITHEHSSLPINHETGKGIFK